MLNDEAIIWNSREPWVNEVAWANAESTFDESCMPPVVVEEAEVAEADTWGLSNEKIAFKALPLTKTIPGYSRERTVTPMVKGVDAYWDEEL